MTLGTSRHCGEKDGGCEKEKEEDFMQEMADIILQEAG